MHDQIIRIIDIEATLTTSSRLGNINTWRYTFETKNLQWIN